MGCTVEDLSSRVGRLEEREVERNAERLEGRVMRLEGREMRAEISREMGEIRKRMKRMSWIMRMDVLVGVCILGSLFALGYLGGFEGVTEFSGSI